MMKRAVLAISAFALLSVPGFAQAPATAAGKAAEMPRTPDGHPDLNGVWEIPYSPDVSLQLGGKLPYTPKGEAEFRDYDVRKFDYTGHCLPAGLTRLVSTPSPFEIFQTNGKIGFLFEGFNSFVSIHTDGRPHPKNQDPNWLGHSVGHWEGDTLVVDSVGFNDKTKLDTIGHPHSDQLHVTMKFTRKDLTHMTFEMTIEDPVMYTEPFKNTRTFTFRPTWDLIEYSCEENNRDLSEGHIK